MLILGAAKVTIKKLKSWFPPGTTIFILIFIPFLFC